VNRPASATAAGFSVAQTAITLHQEFACDSDWGIWDV
jgi:hypothetical protein